MLRLLSFRNKAKEHLLNNPLPSPWLGVFPAFHGGHPRPWLQKVKGVVSGSMLAQCVQGPWFSSQCWKINSRPLLRKTLSEPLSASSQYLLLSNLYMKGSMWPTFFFSVLLSLFPRLPFQGSSSLSAPSLWLADLPSPFLHVSLPPLVSSLCGCTDVFTPCIPNSSGVVRYSSSHMCPRFGLNICHPRLETWLSCCCTFTRVFSLSRMAFWHTKVPPPPWPHPCHGPALHIPTPAMALALPWSFYASCLLLEPLIPVQAFVSTALSSLLHCLPAFLYFPASSVIAAI